MIKKIACVVIVAGGLGLTLAAPASAQSDPVGRRCSFTSITDPTVENGQTQTGQINGGPIGQADQPGATVTITCTIQVGAANSTHDGADTVSCTGIGTGTASVACQANYISPEDQPVFLCTEVTISGKGTFYWDAINPAPDPPASSGSWSRNSSATCSQAIQQEIFPGPLQPVFDALTAVPCVRSVHTGLVEWDTDYMCLSDPVSVVNGVDQILIGVTKVPDPVICPVLAIAFPPEGDIPDAWDCPPYSG